MTDLAERARATKAHLEADGGFIDAPWTLEDFEAVAVENERLRHIELATAVLLALAYQYRDDLRHPVTDSAALSRRIEAIAAAIAKASVNLEQSND